MINAMVFAAGMGTRLRPLTDTRPKALVEVGGDTLLAHTLRTLRAIGVQEVVVNVHHFAAMIVDYLAIHNNFGMRLTVSDESSRLLDTGGGLRKAVGLFSTPAPILVHNVDIVSHVDLRAVVAQHEAAASSETARPLGATLVVAERATSRYLQFDDSGCLTGWHNTQTDEVKGSLGLPRAFAGIHVVDPALQPVLQRTPDEVFSIIPFYLAHCHAFRLQSFEATGIPWVDCGRVESLPRAAEVLASRL